MRGPATCITGCGPTKMERCKLTIDLDRVDEVYYVGKKLSGVVRIELEEPLAITGLELRLYGCSFVSWTDRKVKQVRSSIQHDAEEVYFDDTFILWGQGRNTLSPNIEELPRGRHMFPFQWPIPNDIPCSYEGPFGWVRYHAQCALLHPCCKPGCHTSLTSRAFFTLIRPMDLNAEDEWNLPVHQHREMTLNTPFCKGGKVSCTMELPRSGFVPGEYLQARIDIHNMSPRKIRSTSLTLRQILTFGSEEQHTRRVSWDISRIYGDQVKAGKHQCWSTRGILIPSLVPSSLEGCKYIDAKYELQLRVDLPSQPLILTTPVVIGTAPIMGCYLTSWKYKDSVQYRSRKKRKSLTRSKSIGFSRTAPSMNLDDSSAEYLPKYRVYNTENPRKTLVVLECSPGVRRKSTAKVSLSLPPGNIESVV